MNVFDLTTSSISIGINNKIILPFEDGKSLAFIQYVLSGIRDLPSIISLEDAFNFLQKSVMLQFNGLSEGSLKTVVIFTSARKGLDNPTVNHFKLNGINLVFVTIDDASEELKYFQNKTDMKLIANVDMIPELFPELEQFILKGNGKYLHIYNFIIVKLYIVLVTDVINKL